MSVIQLMVTIIIVTILVTVILGVVSYIAYWLRRVRRPAPAQEVQIAPRFFYRHFPEEPFVEPELLNETDEAEDSDAVDSTPDES
nr:hypothetical protein [Gemmatimonadales bacterium]NIN51288.1 hypothetical protein [Gemmatimonadales bacterium]NIP08752.1 hypothetical protein [Gemmatimonadales bacterium]NIS66182.1 hypothetical protein [Gemmatimonadales bacterium]